MLIHAHDRPGERDDWRSFVSEQGFGTLIADGPTIVPTQFVLDGDEIVLHLARNNPLIPLADGARMVLSVAGDWAHIPGAWKVIDGDPKRGIPTTFYGAVQITGTCRVHVSPEEVARILRLQSVGQKLVDPIEHGPKLRAIVGLRITIDDVRAKFKYGGNLSPEVLQQVITKLEKRKGPGDLAAARHARRRLPPKPVVKLPALPAPWDAALDHPDLAELEAFLEAEQVEHDVFPPIPQVFQAFEHVAPADVRAVILGQDPYHGPGQAHGLSFSVKRPMRTPPSLKNIHTELHDDLGLPAPDHGELTAWAAQGVLLLNTVLTVRARKAASHRKKGWELFTDRVIEALNQREQPVAFVLWGGAAQAYAERIDDRHLVVSSAHPSPFSANSGFFGSKPFSKVDRWLAAQGQPGIDWTL